MQTCIGAQGVVAMIKADPAKGIEINEVPQRRERFGANGPAPRKSRSLWGIVYEMMKDRSLWVLLEAGPVMIALNKVFPGNDQTSGTACHLHPSSRRRNRHDRPGIGGLWCESV